MWACSALAARDEEAAARRGESVVGPWRRRRGGGERRPVEGGRVVAEEVVGRVCAYAVRKGGKRGGEGKGWVLGWVSRGGEGESEGRNKEPEGVEENYCISAIPFPSTRLPPKAHQKTLPTHTHTHARTQRALASVHTALRPAPTHRTPSLLCSFSNRNTRARRRTDSGPPRLGAAKSFSSRLLEPAPAPPILCHGAVGHVKRRNAAAYGQCARERAGGPACAGTLRSVRADLTAAPPPWRKRFLPGLGVSVCVCVRARASPRMMGRIHAHVLFTSGWRVCVHVDADGGARSGTRFDAGKRRRGFGQLG